MKRLVLILLVSTACTNRSEQNVTEQSIEPVVYQVDTSGLIVDRDLTLVLTNCTVCHSGRLIAQNRATREGWKEMIVWMQKTQNLWELGENEDRILDYLEKHYSPIATGRRANLVVENWYKLDQ